MRYAGKLFDLLIAMQWYSILILFNTNGSHERRIGVILEGFLPFPLQFIDTHWVLFKSHWHNSGDLSFSMFRWEKSDRFRQQFSSPRLSCCQCKKRFGSANKLSTHHRSHTKQRPFSCRFCEKRFAVLYLYLYLYLYLSKKFSW